MTASCGCAHVAFNPLVIEPGGRGTLTLVVDIDVDGPRSAEIAVFCNDPANSPVRLRVAWKGTSPVSAEPVNLVFGELRPGEIVQEQVRLIAAVRSNGGRCGIGDPACDPPEALSAAWEEPSDSPLGTRVLNVRLTAPTRLGTHQGTIHFSLSECDRPLLQIPVTWTVRDIVEASPSQLFLGTSGPGEELASTVTISAAQSLPLEVGEAQCGFSEGFSASLERLDSRLVLMRIKILAPQTAGTWSTELIVPCTSPEVREIRVPIFGAVVETRATPADQVTPTAEDPPCPAAD